MYETWDFTKSIHMKYKGTLVIYEVLGIWRHFGHFDHFMVLSYFGVWLRNSKFLLG